MRVIARLLWLLAAAAPGIGGLAASLDPVVVERQADMKSMAARAKSLAEFFSGKKPYDKIAFKADARAVVGMGGGRLIAHFASVTAAEGSKAREEIGTDRPKFEKLARQLSDYAERVAAAASEGETMPETMRMRPGETTEGGPFARKRTEPADVSSYSAEHAFHMMLQTCSLCHAAFRLRR